MVPQKMDVKKIIAIGLLLVSFAMLFLPWVNMSLRVMGTSCSMYDLMQMGGVSKEQFDQLIRENIQKMAMEALEAGIHIDTKSMEKLWTIFMEGKASVAQLAWASSYMNSLLKIEMEEEEIDEVYGMDVISTTIYSKLDSILAVASISLWGGLILAAVTLCYGIYAIVRGKKWGVWPYTVVASAIFLLVMISVGSINGKLESMQTFVGNVGDSMLGIVGSIAGIGGVGGLGSSMLNGILDFKMFHVEIGAYICLIAALGVAVLRLLQMKNVRWAVLPGMGNWPCGCGAINRSESQFCVRCGRARVQNRCSCGAQLQPGASFCNACGARVGGGEPYTPPIPPVHVEPKYVPTVRSDPPKDPEPFQSMGDL